VTTPVGWYSQSDGQQRYWDGEQWTEDFAPGVPLVTLPAGIPDGKPARPWFKKKRLVLPGSALLAIILGSSFSAGAGSDKADPANQTVAAASADSQPTAPEVTAEPSAEPPAAPQIGDYDGLYGTFAPINKSGRGDMTITLPAGVKAGLVIATHKGSSNFQVTGLDAGNQQTIDGLVNEIGNYSGTTAYGVMGLGKPPVKLKITADGTWTIKIAPIASAAVLPVSASGRGDEVFRYEGGAVDVAITHKGTSNFQVQQYGGDLSMGVNEIGDYSGTVPFVSGPTVLVIGADGTWTLKHS
jgi:hypothetical protein